MCAPLIPVLAVAAAGAYAANELTKSSEPKKDTAAAAPVPAPAPMPQAPQAPTTTEAGNVTEADKATAAAQTKEKQAALAARGRNSTILTGPQGLLGGAAQTMRKTLLGQ